MSWGFWAIELSAYLFFLFALVEGFRESLRWGMTVISAALTGLLIELMFVHLAGGYEYGRFAVMLGDAPVWVACGWAFILYYSMKASETLPIKSWSMPIAAALMATGLDLTLDIVAEGQGWWHWKREEADFFGVSYDNFIGWLMIVGCFAGFSKLFVHLWGEDQRWKQIVFPLLVIPASTVVVGGAQFLWEALYRVFGEGPVFLVLYVALQILVMPGKRLAVRMLIPRYFLGLLFIIAVAGGVTEIHPEVYGVFALSLTASLFWFKEES